MKKKKRKSPRHRTRRWRLCVIGCLILLLSARLALFGVKKVENALYPIKYSEFVEYYADKYELDPLLVYAIIRTESGFDPAAHSNADAIGLMQITETAFHWLRAKIAPGEELTFESPTSALAVITGPAVWNDMITIYPLLRHPIFQDGQR